MIVIALRAGSVVEIEVIKAKEHRIIGRKGEKKLSRIDKENIRYHAM